MRRFFMAALFLVVLAAPAQAQLSLQNPDVEEPKGLYRSPADVSVLALIRSAEANNQGGAFEVTMGMLTPIVHGEVYPQLSTPMKSRVDLAFGIAAFELGINNEAEHAFVRVTTAFPGADLKLWFIQLRAALGNDDFEEVYATFKAYRKLSPKEEIPLNDAQVHEIEQGLGTLPNAKEAQLEFESYLEASGWRAGYRFFSFDVIWYHYAQNLLSSGDTEKVYEIAHRIDSPDVLVPMLSDRRFDNVRPAGNPVVAVNESAVRLLESAKTILAEDPKSIDANNVVASRLLLLGRSEEALAQINQTVANAAQLSPLDRRRYDFDEEYYNALLLKSSMLFEFGRYEEALGMVSALAQGGRGPNIGMALYISRWLINLGRGAEALTILNPIEQEFITLDARSDLAQLRACAAAQTKSTALVQDNIRFLKDHTIYKPGALLDALICANDINGASDAVVAALGNERERALMLERLQFYKPPKTRTAHQALMERRLDQVRSHPKIAEAINRVGRINHYDIRFLNPLY